jgi:hypothetical protein
LWWFELGGSLVLLVRGGGEEWSERLDVDIDAEAVDDEMN